MPIYAYQLINDPRTGDKYQPGDELPEDLPGLDELELVGTEPYDPDKEPKEAPPEVVVIDGVRYVQANDGAETEDVRS